MRIKGRRKAPSAETETPFNLKDVFQAVDGAQALSVTRRRDMRSAVKRVAKLLGDDPARLVLDLPAISAKLATISPVALGLSSKSFSNMRSDFLAAVKASGLKSVSGKTRMIPAWAKLVAGLSQKRARIGLSRLARHASAAKIAPYQINDAVIESFVTAVREGSLHRKPNALYRLVSRVWNEVAQRPGSNLPLVSVPSFRPPVRRINWMLLPKAFRNEVAKYLAWCSGSDSFAADVRARALAPQTLRLVRDQIHAGVTALVESGIKPAAIRSLSDLFSPENFTRILRQRHQTVGGRENCFNGDLARALIRIAREWVKLDAGVLLELSRLAAKVRVPLAGLTPKNKRFLRQFDDPAAYRRLYRLPERLWAELNREGKLNQRALAKAQAAIAIAILCYMPIRLQNLIALTFDVHLFLREGARATSSLEVPAHEVKNRRELAFDIPLPVAKMLLEYRNSIAPSIIGRRPDRLFVRIDGTPKSHETLAFLIRTYLKRYAGIIISAHQFRHLAAKTLLDAEPGNFETPKQLLGHTNIRMTVGAYAGIDSRRAGRHHQRLLEQSLAPQKPIQQRKKRAS
jgi:integrase